MIYRRTRYSAWYCVLISIPLIMITLFLSMFIVYGAFEFLFDWGILNSRAIKGEYLLVIVCIITSIVSIIIYKKLHWKIVDDPTHYCPQCTYNLTGNESGVCLECGMKIQT